MIIANIRLNLRPQKQSTNSNANDSNQFKIHIMKITKIKIEVTIKKCG